MLSNLTVCSGNISDSQEKEDNNIQVYGKDFNYHK